MSRNFSKKVRRFVTNGANIPQMVQVPSNPGKSSKKGAPVPPLQSVNPSSNGNGNNSKPAKKN